MVECAHAQTQTHNARDVKMASDQGHMPPLGKHRGWVDGEDGSAPWDVRTRGRHWGVEDGRAPLAARMEGTPGAARMAL